MATISSSFGSVGRRHNRLSFEKKIVVSSAKLGFLTEELISVVSDKRRLYEFHAWWIQISNYYGGFWSTEVYKDQEKIPGENIKYDLETLLSNHSFPGNFIKV